jgi:hypothetical protein
MTRKGFSRVSRAIVAAALVAASLSGCSYRAVSRAGCNYTATGTGGSITVTQTAAGRPLTIQVAQTYSGTIRYTGTVSVDKTTYKKVISQTTPPSVRLDAAEVAKYKGKTLRVGGSAASVLGTVAGTYSCVIQ